MTGRANRSLFLFSISFNDRDLVFSEHSKARWWLPFAKWVEFSKNGKKTSHGHNHPLDSFRWNRKRWLQTTVGSTVGQWVVRWESWGVAMSVASLWRSRVWIFTRDCTWAILQKKMYDEGWYHRNSNVTLFISFQYSTSKKQRRIAKL